MESIIILAVCITALITAFITIFIIEFRRFWKEESEEIIEDEEPILPDFPRYGKCDDCGKWTMLTYYEGDMSSVCTGCWFDRWDAGEFD